MKKLTQIKQNIYLLKMNKKTQIFDSIYFVGKSYFKTDGTQNCLVFQPLYRYFKSVVNSNYVIEFKSKETSDESIKSPSSPHNFSHPSLNYLGTKTRVGFSGSYLKQDIHSWRHSKHLHCLWDKEKLQHKELSIIRKHCLFYAVTLTKNFNIDNYKYSEYDVGFDRKGKLNVYGLNVYDLSVDYDAIAVY